MRLNLVVKDKSIEHYKEQWYGPSVPQEVAEKAREDTGVDAITIEELERALSFVKNRKAAG